MASVLGMGSGAAVSVQARRCDRWLEADPKLRRLTEKIERSLMKKKAEREKAK